MKCWLLTLIALNLCSAPLIFGLPSSYDLCEAPNDDGLVEATRKNSLPQAGRGAGNYSVVTENDGVTVQSIFKCAEACCANAAGHRCDVAIFRKNDKGKTCFLLACDPEKPGGCDPVSMTFPEDQSAYMITLRRQVGKKNRIRDRFCSPDKRGASCPKGELCEPNSSDGSYICVCPTGQTRVPSSKDDHGKCIAPSTTKNPSSAAVRSKVCEYGLNECGANEHCVVSTRLSKGGICRCKRGFTRDAAGKCIEHPAAPETLNATTVASPTSNVSSPSNITKATRDTPASLTTPPSLSSTTPPRVSSSTAAPTTVAKLETNKRMDKTPKVQKVTILLENNYTITLPQNDLKIHAKVKAPATEKKLTYHWSLLSNPEGAEKGTIEGNASPDLHLSKIIAGDYVFKLTVRGPHSYGEAETKVVVLPPKRTNKPPVAIVKSATEVVQLPNNLVLDGTRSSDDDGIVSYNWEEVSGPLVRQDLKGTDKGVLQLKGLKPGDYIFKLTVQDSDGATNSTLVNVTVVKEKDYPPVANAGPSQVIQLPKNSVTLYGNASTDDHGIKSYEWVQISKDKLAADLQGVRQPILRLNSLEEGDYVFQLKVTDTAGQSSTAKVKVYVNPRHNVAPTANAGGDRTVTLPLQVITLDGSKSEDDEKIVKLLWEQISGPHTLVLKHSNEAKLEVSGLKVGVYKFRLTVWDKEKLRSESTCVLTVQESRNLPPKAKAGEDQIVVLPQNFVRLDGSKSWDDKAIVSYRWTRTEESLAAGTVLNHSDHQAVLLLTDLVPGKYAFNLEVADKEGQRHSDRIDVIVKPDANLKNMLEIRFKGNLQQFSENNKKDLINQFKLLLSKAFPKGEIIVHVEGIRQVFHSGSIVVRFYVTQHMRGSNSVLPGRKVLFVLRKRFSAGVTLLDVVIERMDTAVCLSNCSGHGRCHPLTRQCVCEAFWMENSLRVHYGDGERNCDWSILYVIVLSCLAVLVVAAMIWLVIWCKRRRQQDDSRTRTNNISRFRYKLANLKKRWRRPRNKRHKYTLLNEFDEKDGGLKLPALPHRNGGNSKGRRKGSGGSGNNSGGGVGGGTESGMVASESDLTSDEEETLFINKRPVNGGVGSVGQVENKSYLRSNGVAGAL